MKNSKKYSIFSLTGRALESQGKFRVLFWILHWKVLQIFKNFALSKNRVQSRKVSLTNFFRVTFINDNFCKFKLIVEIIPNILNWISKKKNTNPFSLWVNHRKIRISLKYKSYTAFTFEIRANKKYKGSGNAFINYLELFKITCNLKVKLLASYKVRFDWFIVRDLTTLHSVRMHCTLYRGAIKRVIALYIHWKMLYARSITMDSITEYWWHCM